MKGGGGNDGAGDGDEEECRPWRRRLLSAMAVSSWSAALRISLLLFLLIGIVTAFVTLPVEKILKDFLYWIKQSLGPWGPLVLALAYIPLTVLAVPASVLTLGGGYLFGLFLGFIADSIGATIGATAAFLLGRTIGRPYVISKLKDYPKFQAVAIAIQRSGFKIVVLLRLVPLLPFNMLNYLLSVTPVSIGEYMLATWLGMMPITLALVYVGTTLKDLADVTHGWSEISTTRLVFIACGFTVSVILIICVTRVAKASLEKALAENPEVEDILVTGPQLPLTNGSLTSNLHEPLVIRVDTSNEGHSN
ncbi:SNARE associated Golgi protein family [Rhynchospora pubera]|uniref:SNARE associated Golgi protein family n=1 Tax=Rhynchospora pubera TaxID=906938 RepID=A0AAV8CMK4_9POAL|nr:SNARE associated Golgi protein family [Rhynchospora pubera]